MPLSGDLVGKLLVIKGKIPAHLRADRRFYVEIRWTPLHMGFRPWRRSWWRLLKMVWGRFGESWAVMGGAPDSGYMHHDVESTCVAFGPFVIVVQHPPPNREMDR